MDASKPARSLKIRDEFAILIVSAILGRTDQMIEVSPEQRAKVAKQAVDWAESLCAALEATERS